jgi:acetate kinase
MNEVILVLNAGSSSIKFCLYTLKHDQLGLLYRGLIQGLYGRSVFTVTDVGGRVAAEQTWPSDTPLTHAAAMDHLSKYLASKLAQASVRAVGHRVVHGGTQYSQPLIINGDNIDQLNSLGPLAPLHQPHNLAPIQHLLKQFPGLPQVACFDTAFHRSSPLVAQLYALPKKYAEAGIRRYGFHGLSYEYITEQLKTLSPRAYSGKTIVCHLGSGASMCAINNGTSVASTMGFTAVEGLLMGTRSGSIDPGVVIYLLDHYAMTTRDIENLLYKESGLLGVSGISSDMRELLASASEDAKLAIDLYLYQIRRSMGALAAVLGGLDAIVFTAGVGENSAEIRAAICDDAKWLGVTLDDQLNDSAGSSAICISSASSPVQVWKIATNEELMIAQHTLTATSKKVENDNAH